VCLFIVAEKAMIKMSVYKRTIIYLVMAQSFIYGIILLCYGALFIVTAYHTWNRKSIQPLKAREPRLMLISYFGALVIITMICFREINRENFPCSAYIWTSNVFFALFVLPYFLVMCRIVFMYIYNSRLANEDQLAEEFGKKQKLFSNKSKVFFIIVGIILQIIVGYFMDMYRQKVDNEDGTGCEFDKQFYPLLIEVLVYLVLFGFGLFLIRKVNDPFGIAFNLRISTLNWLIFGSLFFLSNLWEPLFVANEWFAASTWLIIMLFINIFISIIIPLLKTHSTDSEKVSKMFFDNMRNAYSTVDQIFDSVNKKEAVNALKIYLTNCLDVNPLMFLLDVEKFKEANEEQRKTIAADINDKYLEEGSSQMLQQIVYSKDILDSLIKQYASNTKHKLYPPLMFISAEEIIKSYIQNTHMSRFMESKQYKKLCENTSVGNNIAQAYINEELID